MPRRVSPWAAASANLASQRLALALPGHGSSAAPSDPPGLIEVAGVAMGIAGTIQRVRDVGVDGSKIGPKLRLGVGPARILDGGTMALGARLWRLRAHVL